MVGFGEIYETGRTRTVDVHFGTCARCDREHWYGIAQPHNVGPVVVREEAVIHCPCGATITYDEEGMRVTS